MTEREREREREREIQRAKLATPGGGGTGMWEIPEGDLSGALRLSGRAAPSLCAGCRCFHGYVDLYLLLKFKFHIRGHSDIHEDMSNVCPSPKGIQLVYSH
jgi:hypothetical protein